MSEATADFVELPRTVESVLSAAGWTAVTMGLILIVSRGDP
jgi:hypothetical protein